MIYTVDIRFSNPSEEADWNAWYCGHLTEMVKIPGMTTAQRFAARTADGTTYLAIYSIESPEVFASEGYRTIAGAGPRSKWHSFISRRRNLYAGIATFPEISDAARLAVSPRPPRDHDRADLHLLSVSAVAFDRDPPQRSFGVAAGDAAHESSAPDLMFYAPLTDRRHAGAMAPAG